MPPSDNGKQATPMAAAATSSSHPERHVSRRGSSNSTLRAAWASFEGKEKISRGSHWNDDLQTSVATSIKEKDVVAKTRDSTRVVPDHLYGKRLYERPWSEDMSRYLRPSSVRKPKQRWSPAKSATVDTKTDAKKPAQGSSTTDVSAKTSSPVDRPTAATLQRSRSLHSPRKLKSDVNANSPNSLVPKERRFSKGIARLEDLPSIEELRQHSASLRRKLKAKEASDSARKKFELKTETLSDNAPALKRVQSARNRPRVRSEDSSQSTIIGSLKASPTVGSTTKEDTLQTKSGFTGTRSRKTTERETNRANEKKLEESTSIGTKMIETDAKQVNHRKVNSSVQVSPKPIVFSLDVPSDPGMSSAVSMEKINNTDSNVPTFAILDTAVAQALSLVSQFPEELGESLDRAVAVLTEDSYSADFTNKDDQPAGRSESPQINSSPTRQGSTSPAPQPTVVALQRLKAAKNPNASAASQQWFDERLSDSNSKKKSKMPKRSTRKSWKFWRSSKYNIADGASTSTSPATNEIYRKSPAVKREILQPQQKEPNSKPRSKGSPVDKHRQSEFDKNVMLQESDKINGNVHSALQDLRVEPTTSFSYSPRKKVELNSPRQRMSSRDDVPIYTATVEDGSVTEVDGSQPPTPPSSVPPASESPSPIPPSPAPPGSESPPVLPDLDRNSESPPPLPPLSPPPEDDDTFDQSYDNVLHRLSTATPIHEDRPLSTTSRSSESEPEDWC